MYKYFVRTFSIPTFFLSSLSLSFPAYPLSFVLSIFLKKIVSYFLSFFLTFFIFILFFSFSFLFQSFLPYFFLYFFPPIFISSFFPSDILFAWRSFPFYRYSWSCADLGPSSGSSTRRCVNLFLEKNIYILKNICVDNIFLHVTFFSTFILF